MPRINFLNGGIESIDSERFLSISSDIAKLIILPPLKLSFAFKKFNPDFNLITGERIRIITVSNYTNQLMEPFYQVTELAEGVNYPDIPINQLTYRFNIK
ncbi:MAG: hypothetical protein Q8Q35_03460 [Nanoarchaeota archaeon]|nr:hypothetical protein [Nanoarchaeota archaeon]